MYMHMNDGKDDRAKIERTLMNGIWLGIKGRTGEHFIGIEKNIGKSVHGEEETRRGKMVD